MPGSVLEHGVRVSPAAARLGRRVVRLKGAFYVGRGSLERIGERLLAHGRDPATPAVVIKDGTRSTQRIPLVRLDGLGDRA